MSKYLIFYLLFISTEVLFAQDAFITAYAPGVLYAGLENPIAVSVENCSCKLLVAKTTKGSLQGKGCRYLYTLPFDLWSNSTWTDIEVYKKENGKLVLLSKGSFKVVKMPDPFPLVKFNTDSTILYYAIQKRKFDDFHPQPPDITAQVPFFDYSYALEYGFYVDTFNISVYRTGILKASNMNVGAYFTEETYKIFEDLENGDKLVFDNIRVWGVDGSRRKLKSVQLVVIGK